MKLFSLFLVTCAFVLTTFAEDTDVSTPQRMSPMLAANWTELTPYPIETSEVQGAILPGGDDLPAELIVLGGTPARSGWRPVTTSYALNINEPNGTWRRVKDLPDKTTHQGHAVVADILYLCGGYVGRFGQSIPDCYGYNHTADDYFSIPPLPEARDGGGMVYIERMNALFFAGGSRRVLAGLRNETDFADAWMLELGNLTKGWVKKADLPNPRNHVSAVSVKDRVFFVGGQHRADEKRGNQRSNQEYIPEVDVWVERAPLPIEMGHAMASINPYLDGYIMVGGSTKGLRLLDHVLYYHLSSDSWHFMADYVRLAKSMVCGIKRDQLVCAVGQAAKPGRWDDAWSVTLTKLKEVNDFMTR